jgi:hypothetical protein
VFENADFVAWANENVVFLVGHTGRNHKVTPKKDDGKDKDGKNGDETPKDGAPKDGEKPEPKGDPAAGAAKPGECTLYPGITCDEHEKIFADAKEGTGGPKLEVKGFPTSYMVAPDGTFELHTKDRSVKELEDGVADWTKKKALKPNKKFLTYLAALDEGDEDVEAGKWKAAIAAYLKVDAVGKKMKGLGASLAPKVTALNDAVVKAFAKVRDDESKDLAAKNAEVKALRADVSARFAAGPLPVVADLDAWLKANPPPPPPAKK